MARVINPDKARAVAEAYCTNGFNKRNALMSAGFPEKYSKSTAGSRLFNRPVIRNEINKILDRNADAVDVSIAEIVRGFKLIAFPPEGVTVRNSDKNMALSHLAKYKNMFNDRLIVPTEAKRLSDSKKVECRLIANLLVSPEYQEKRRELMRQYEEESLPTDDKIING